MTSPVTAEIISTSASTAAARAIAETAPASEKPKGKAAGTADQASVPRAPKQADDPVTRKPEYLALSLIRTDGGTQARVEINTAVVEEYAEAQRQGAELPPVVLYHDKDGDIYWLADGFHRFHAHRLNDREDILAVVRDGTRRDAVLHAAGANGAHGLRRSNADKRRAVTMLLKDVEWVQWSDREIAKSCDVSHMLVATVRREHLEEMPDSLAPAASIDRTVTRNGTTYQQKVKAKSEGKSLVPAVLSQTPLDDAPTPEDCMVLAASGAEDPQASVLQQLHAECESLRAENDQLRAQLGHLAAQFGEAMAYHDDMRAILEASISLDETSPQLQEALELARILESRLAEAVAVHEHTQG